MAAGPQRRIPSSTASGRRLLALLGVALWLMVLAWLGFGQVASAARATLPGILPTATPTSAATATFTPRPATPTPKATATNQGNETPTAGATATAPAATATTVPTVDTGGGYVAPSGPQPTRVVFTQPTVGTGSGGGLGGLTPSTIASNGLLVATTLSCLTGLLGLIIAGISLTVLLRGGYGPFLRLLVLGRRAGKRARAEAAARASWGDAANLDDGHFDEGDGSSDRWPQPAPERADWAGVRPRPPRDRAYQPGSSPRRGAKDW